jgi:hypothetical protein
MGSLQPVAGALLDQTALDRGTGYLKDSALRGRSFTSLNAQNEFLRHWEKTVADLRIHGTTRMQIAALFSAEDRHAACRLG